MSAITWISGPRAIFSPNKIEGGHESDGTIIYVARAYYKDGTHPGKFSANTEGKAAVGFGGSSYLVSDFEIAESSANLTWVSFSGSFSVDKFKALGKGDPVEGGSFQKSGGPVTKLYICQADITDGDGKQAGTQCGKVWENDLAAIPYGTKEYVVKSYKVLAYSG